MKTFVLKVQVHTDEEVTPSEILRMVTSGLLTYDTVHGADALVDSWSSDRLEFDLDL